MSSFPIDMLDDLQCFLELLVLGAKVLKFKIYERQKKNETNRRGKINERKSQFIRYQNKRKFAILEV